jgi:HEAT repeat protein
MPIRHPAPGPPHRPPRDEADRAGEAFRHVAGAELLLRRDPHAAFGPVSEWLREAQSPLERRAAVKLLGRLRVQEAHDLLAEEVKSGPARDWALDGLVLLRDPRSREVFRSVLDDPDAPLDPTRVKAAGGLHRLGDPRGLEFLRNTFQATPPGSRTNDELRQRVLCHVIASPSREAVAVLPELIQGVRLDPKHRGLLIELLTLSGLADSDPALISLIKSGRATQDSD